MLIDLDTAKRHLRVDSDDDDAQILICIGAAERYAAEFIERNIYPTQEAFTAAVAAAPAALSAATVAYDAAVATAEGVTVAVERDMAMMAANETYSTAQTAARATYRGIVINDQIKAAMLLITGHLFENREDTIVGLSVETLPMGSRALLQPFRAY